jgi:hypothetical protein
MTISVSYCITCKGRLHHLRQTLPKNLAAEARNRDVEFVLLDYDSSDGLENWVRDTLGEEVAQGRLVYARHEPAPNFKMAHSKNMAHRLGSGRILCNLDADNLLPENFSTFLKSAFRRDENSVFSPRQATIIGFVRQRWLDRFLGIRRPGGGICGRIAITKVNFEKVGGYDEDFTAWGTDDIDFLLRARDLGLAVRKLPQQVWGDVLDHDDEERVQNLSERDRTLSTGRLKQSSLGYTRGRIAMLLRRGRQPANDKHGFGCGAVRIGFDGPVRQLGPIRN